MICPNTQVATNGYAASSVGVQDHFPQNVLKFGFGDWKWKNVYEKRRPNPIFPQDPPKIGCVDGKVGKKYVKREESKYLF